jgi:hypothetical protein
VGEASPARPLKLKGAYEVKRRKSMKTYIYSGQCRLCEIGRETSILTNKEEKLYTGDIVMIMTKDNNYAPHHLTAVCADDWENVQGNEPVYKGKSHAFIMGIKDSCIKNKGEDWYIYRVKSYKDVVDGEHWKAYGFSYMSFEE